LTPNIRYRSVNYETVRGLVARGLGYSILNQRPVHDVTYGGGTVQPREIANDLPALRVVTAQLSTVRSTARAIASRAIEARARAVPEPCFCRERLTVCQHGSPFHDPEFTRAPVPG
jgi:DNA-binding transcriptional LysR family regulator